MAISTSKKDFEYFKTIVENALKGFLNSRGTNIQPEEKTVTDAIASTIKELNDFIGNKTEDDASFNADSYEGFIMTLRAQTPANNFTRVIPKTWVFGSDQTVQIQSSLHDTVDAMVQKLEHRLSTLKENVKTSSIEERFATLEKNLSIKLGEAEKRAKIAEEEAASAKQQLALTTNAAKNFVVDLGKMNPAMATQFASMMGFSFFASPQATTAALPEKYKGLNDKNKPLEYGIYKLGQVVSDALRAVVIDLVEFKSQNKADEQAIDSLIFNLLNHYNSWETIKDLINNTSLDTQDWKNLVESMYRHGDTYSREVPAVPENDPYRAHKMFANLYGKGGFLTQNQQSANHFNPEHAQYVGLLKPTQGPKR